MRTILLVNLSKRADLTELWLANAANTLAVQLQRDVCPAYGLAPISVLVAGAHTTRHLDRHGIDVKDCEELVIFEEPDVTGALGYHDKTPNGTPYGKAFAHVDGQAVTLAGLLVTLSHEAIEIAVNPEADCVEFGAPDGVGRYHEPCDPVEDVTYPIDNAVVSDFVLPAWFENGAPGPYDKCGVLARPMTRTDGGYVILHNGEDVVTDPPERAAEKAHETSRLSKIRRRWAEANKPETASAEHASP